MELRGYGVMELWSYFDKGYSDSVDFNKKLMLVPVSPPAALDELFPFSFSGAESLAVSHRLIHPAQGE